MDSLKSLLDDKKYELVIKITKGSKNINDLFYRIAAFVCLGQYQEALFVIQDNQEILNDNLSALIPTHIQLLCTLDKFEQAEAALQYYSNLPYQSQEVEEILRRMPDVIENEKKQKNAKYFTDEEVIEKLESNKNEDIIFALDLLKKRDVLSFLPYIKRILSSYHNQTIRSLALLLLVEKEVDRELNYLSEGSIISVNPKHIEVPFKNANFNKIVKKLSYELKNPTLANYATQVLASYVIFIFPHQIEDNEVDELYVAICLSAKRMLEGDKVDVERECDEKEVDVNHVNFYLNKIDLVLHDI